MENEQKNQEDYYKRYMIVLGMYNKYIDYPLPELPNIRNLRFEAERSYYYGNYTSVILAISSALETTLETFVKKGSFSASLKQMIEEKLISQELFSEIDYYRKNVYNLLKHDFSMSSLFNIGWEKDNSENNLHVLKNDRLQKIIELNKLSASHKGILSNEYLALEGLELYYKLFNELKGKERKYI